MTQKPNDSDERRDASVGADATERDEAVGKVGVSQRKERVLHTRVPAVLEQELKRLAESLRMPVSNVVRAILEDAVTAVDVVGRKAEGEMNRVVDRMAEKRERLRHIANNKPEPGASGGGEVDAPEVGGERDAECDAERDDTTPDASAAKLEGVIGFQPLLLASSSTCSVCGQPLKAGTEAYLGVRDGTGPRVLIGPACLPKPDDD